MGGPGQTSGVPAPNRGTLVRPVEHAPTSMSWNPHEISDAYHIVLCVHVSGKHTPASNRVYRPS